MAEIPGGERDPEPDSEREPGERVRPDPPAEPPAPRERRDAPRGRRQLPSPAAARLRRHRPRGATRTPGGRRHPGAAVGPVLPPPSPRDRLSEELAELRRLPSPRGVPAGMAPRCPRFPLAFLAVRTPCPPPPAVAARRIPALPKAAASRSLPDLREGRRLLDELGLRRPRGRLSPEPRVAPAAPMGDPAAARDLRRLLLRRGVPSGGRGLPPLLAALPRRRGDAGSLRREQPDPVPPPPPRPPRPGLGAELAAPRVPRRALGAAVPLRSFGPLGAEAPGAELPAAEEPLPGRAVRELYGALAPALPGERLRFEQRPPLQPPAAPRLWARRAEPPEPPEPPALNAELRRQRCPVVPGGPAALPWPRGGSWRRWWRSAFGFDDFLKFVATADTDYLHVAFGLRGPGGARERPAPPPPRPTEAAPAARAEPPAAAAERFVPGLWNAAAPERAAAPAPRRLQRRLERLWAALHVPGRDKVAMAVAHGTGTGTGTAWLRAWEAAAGRIQERELLLARLEALEGAASDPDRLFRRGGGGTGTEDEARARRRLLAALARHEGPLGAALRRLRGRSGSGTAVAFRGRPYLAKMRWDRVEMLYWLQQGRRAATLLPARPRGTEPEREGAGKGR